MEKEYHTLNEGIPIQQTAVTTGPLPVIYAITPQIGMGTNQDREGLHFWISRPKENPQPDESPVESMSVHLTRRDALNLIEEIRHRLF